VIATDEQWKELCGNENPSSFKRVFAVSDHRDMSALLLLDYSDSRQLEDINVPVLINAVVPTLTEMHAPGNVLRMNGWPGFIKRTVWEIAGNLTPGIQHIFAAAGKQLIAVADAPGLVAARPVAMIVNEAYFALGEQISSKEEIDIAMKLGTNYPFGPFEWAGLIGLPNIWWLLKKLSGNSKRYLPAPLLEKEASA